MFKNLSRTSLWITGATMITFALIMIPATYFMQESSAASAAVPGPIMKVIVDMDPGADDSMALMLLLMEDNVKLDIIAVSTVAGNADIDSVTRNAIRTLQVAKRFDIPVYKGAGRGLVHQIVEGLKYFGSDGFGETTFDTHLPEYLVRDEVAANMLVNRVRAMPNQVTVLALGPLTNIALAIGLYPNFLKEVKHLIILGGSYQGIGNVKPGAEFNFYCDPEAAQLVLSMATVENPITLLPIETVSDASFSMTWRQNTLGQLNSTVMQFLNKIEAYSLQSKDIWKPYDPAAACIVINPLIVNNSKMISAKVLCCPDNARGVIIVDYKSDNANIELVTEINQDILKNILLENLAK